MSCAGVTPFDKILLGDVNYLPWKGFPGFFFPYRGQDGYLEPLVAVHFANPRSMTISLHFAVYSYISHRFSWNGHRCSLHSRRT